MKKLVTCILLMLSWLVPMCVVAVSATAYAAETIATPEKPYKIQNVVSGVHVYWKNVDGVEKYGVYRSENGADGTYKWIAGPTVAHFTDTDVESGKTYHYKITAFDPETGKQTEKSPSLGIVFVSTPDITKRENTPDGIKLSWEKITGAFGYAIYRKSFYNNDNWIRVGTITSGSTLNWTDNSVKDNNGIIYRYTIRALSGYRRTTLSGCYGNGKTMVRLASRTLKNAEMVSEDSIKCSWTTTKEATGYEVRFMSGQEECKTFTIGNYKTGVKTFTGLETGKEYRVQVRSYKKVEGIGCFYSEWSEEKLVILGEVIQIPNPTVSPSPTISPTQDSYVEYLKWGETVYGSIGITGLKDNSITEIVIPAQIDGMDVTSIGYKAFENCSNLVSVKISDGITHIGNYAFAGCSNLINIDLPESIISIGDDGGVFKDCSSLKTIKIPSKVTKIWGNTFYNCSDLENIELPDGLTYIGGRAFEKCSKLASIEIPDGVTKIGISAFQDCSSLMSVEISNSVECIDISCFLGCTSLTNVKLSDNLKTIGSAIFKNCTSLTSIELPNTLNEISYSMFCNCNSLTEIEIPNSVTSIGKHAFLNCYNLNSIKIPDSVNSIGISPLKQCLKLRSIKVKKDSYAETWAKENGYTDLLVVE